MRILQLIDSLRPGGAEQMAVAYANALSRRGQEAFLCCTRMEGLLKEGLEPEVRYLFLGKRSTLDWRAYRRLRGFVTHHHIELIQAHSSSFFLAVLIKLSVPGIKLVWHDHYGRELAERKDRTLKLMSAFFDGVISVNEDLKEWALKNLKCSRVIFVRNFLAESAKDKPRTTPKNDLLLKGNHKIKIICVANLRPQKDHLNLLRAFELVVEEYPDVSLHLVGKEEENDYAWAIRSYIQEKELKEHVFLYGEQQNIQDILNQADIAVLSSSSEGLPVALLEYAAAGLPVVCTDVGEIKGVLNGNGLLVPPEDPFRLAEALKQYWLNPDNVLRQAKAFQEEIIQGYSESAVFPKAISFHKSILNQ